MIELPEGDERPTRDTQEIEEREKKAEVAWKEARQRGGAKLGADETRNEFRLLMHRGPSS